MRQIFHHKGKSSGERSHKLGFNNLGLSQFTSAEFKPTDDNPRAFGLSRPRNARNKGIRMEFRLRAPAFGYLSLGKIELALEWADWRDEAVERQNRNTSYETESTCSAFVQTFTTVKWYVS